MTFNNIEIPVHTITPPTPNTYIYDGVDLAMIHDGLHRYVIVKDIETAVRLPEPNTNTSNYAHVIGDNVTSVFVVNVAQKQVRKITSSGANLTETVVNLNDYNRFRSFEIVGTNLTQNVFIPQGGGVQGSAIVIGGYISNPTGFSIGGQVVQANAICYMSSEDSGATWTGPWFPFIHTDTAPFGFMEGTVVAALFYKDNWYFQLTNRQGSQYDLSISVVESLGVDLIGDLLQDGPISAFTETETIYQLPFLAHNNFLFFSNTNRTGYYTYNLETDTPTFTTLDNVTNFTKNGSTVDITTENDCNITINGGAESTGQNIISAFTLGSTNLLLVQTAGKILVNDDQTQGVTNPMLNTVIETDHYLQPSEIIEPAGFGF